MNEYVHDIAESVATIRNGGILLYPTDTVWGIGGDATNDAVIERIIPFKKRPLNKSLVVLVADIEQLIELTGPLDSSFIKFLRSVTKPTTVVYSTVRTIASLARAQDGSVAIRVTRDPFCQEIIRASGVPIISTSANISGEPTPQLFSNIAQVIRDGVDYVVSYRQNETEPQQASSIVRWNNGDIEIIRP